tara:strand:+ start:81 stop:1850 length:1770 start_codon:yes stop_codon:yes gene_type:complete
MKILRLLNKIYLLLLLIFFFNFHLLAENKPVDIWNINQNNLENEISESQIKIEENNNVEEEKIDIFNIQSKKNSDPIELEKNLNSRDIKIIGLYDPEDYGLDINMWTNSNGDQLKSIFSKLDKIKLSEDAKEIMNISLLTNAYNPKFNITEKEFLNYKSDWLIKNSDLVLIEEYLLQNQIINLHPNLTRFLVDQHLLDSNVEKACEVFFKNLDSPNDDYLSKFNIYCLINSGKIEEAQLLFDLKKELGFKDKYFEKKINFLFGYEKKIDDQISEKSILDFHLAHKTNPNFVFEPTDKTDRLIWKYLSSFNLLYNIDEIELTEIDKISTIEKAAHNKNFPEKDLFEIYKRFQFNINQLLNAKESHKTLSSIESRALIYQKILLESDMVEKLKLLLILKNIFKKDKIENAFDNELKKYLEKIDPLKIPANLTSFYYTNIDLKEDRDKKIKYNNSIIHQSKLINYFNGDYTKSKIEKDVNNFLKKVKKDKKYFLSKKDVILLESLKSDGVEISKKYDNLYEIDVSEIPTDIQVMINNNEMGAALLRIVEVIGQDKLDRIDEDTMYFIIFTLNQLDIDVIRNKILLKVLPLKV